MELFWKKLVGTRTDFLYERTEAQHQNVDIFFVIIKQKVVVEIYRDK